MGVTVWLNRSEGRQAISLAALAAFVEDALQECQQRGVDPDTVQPHAHVGLFLKVKRVEVDIR